MHFGQSLQTDNGWIERHDDAFGPGVRGRLRLYEALVHLGNASKRLKDALRAPVAAATKPDFHYSLLGKAGAAPFVLVRERAQLMNAVIRCPTTSAISTWG